MDNSKLMMLTDTEVQVILSLAKHNMVTTKVAKEFFYSEFTIRLKCKKIREKTGLNPKVFCDLVKLVEMVEGMSDNG